MLQQVQKVVVVLSCMPRLYHTLWEREMVWRKNKKKPVELLVSLESHTHTHTLCCYEANISTVSRGTYICCLCLKVWEKSEINICFSSLLSLNRVSRDGVVSWSEREHRCSDFQKRRFTLQAKSRHSAPTLRSSYTLMHTAPIYSLLHVRLTKAHIHT